MINLCERNVSAIVGLYKKIRSYYEMESIIGQHTLGYGTLHHYTRVHFYQEVLSRMIESEKGR